MKSTIDHLLVQRYEVQTNHPESTLKKGDILTRINGAQYRLNEEYGTIRNIIDIDSYPLIFREMRWWGRRDNEDMPQYVKIHSKIPSIPEAEQYSVFKVRNHNIGGEPYCSFCGSEFGFSLHYNCLEPATESEYNEWQNKK